MAFRTVARPGRLVDPLAMKPQPETTSPNGSHRAPVKRIIRNSLSTRY
jgi:hypothetical protein